MKARSLKIITIAVVLLTIVSIGLIYGFSSYQEMYFAHPINSNGTIISAAALKNINVRGEMQFDFSGTQNGNATVILQNGTQYTLSNANPQLTIKFNFTASHFTGNTFVEGGVFNVSLSPSHPMDSGAIYNSSLSYFENYLPGYTSGQFTNYFYVFIENSPVVLVKMDGVAF